MPDLCEFFFFIIKYVLWATFRFTCNFFLSWRMCAQSDPQHGGSLYCLVETPSITTLSASCLMFPLKLHTKCASKVIWKLSWIDFAIPWLRSTGKSRVVNVILFFLNLHSYCFSIANCIYYIHWNSRVMAIAFHCIDEPCTNTMASKQVIQVKKGIVNVGCQYCKHKDRTVTVTLKL